MRVVVVVSLCPYLYLPGPGSRAVGVVAGLSPGPLLSLNPSLYTREKDSLFLNVESRQHHLLSRGCWFQRMNSVVSAGFSLHCLHTPSEDGLKGVVKRISLVGRAPLSAKVSSLNIRTTDLTKCELLVLLLGRLST